MHRLAAHRAVGLVQHPVQAQQLLGIVHLSSCRYQAFPVKHTAHSTPALTKGVDAHQGQGKVKHQRPRADSCRRDDDPLAAKVVASGDKGGLTKEAGDEQPASTQRWSAHSSAVEPHCVVSTAPYQGAVTSCTWERVIQGLQQARCHCCVSTKR